MAKENFNRIDTSAVPTDSDSIMNRRSFLGKSVMGTLGIMFATGSLASCSKEELCIDNMTIAPEAKGKYIESQRKYIVRPDFSIGHCDGIDGEFEITLRLKDKHGKIFQNPDGSPSTRISSYPLDETCCFDVPQQASNNFPFININVYNRSTGEAFRFDQKIAYIN